MYCNQCGSKIPHGSLYCPGCGMPAEDGSAKPIIGDEPFSTTASTVYNAVNNPYDNAVPVYGGGTEAIGSTLGRVPARLIAKIAFLVALICFAFPFMSVSCDSSTITGSGDDYNAEVVYSGYNLLYPSTITDKNLKMGEGLENIYNLGTQKYAKKSDKELGSEEKQNPWLAVTALCCIAGIIVLFIKMKPFAPIAACGCGIIALISLIIFQANFKSRYITNGKTNIGEVNGVLKVNVKFGFILCLLAVITAIIASMIACTGEKHIKREQF